MAKSSKVMGALRSLLLKTSAPIPPPRLYDVSFQKRALHSDIQHYRLLSALGKQMQWTTVHNRTSNYLKLYVLKVFFSNKYVTAQVFHTPTSTVAAAASSQEKDLRQKMETRADCAAAAQIGKVLAERLKEKEIPAVHFYYKKDQRYHGKLKALIDGIREHGINFVG